MGGSKDRHGLKVDKVCDLTALMHELGNMRHLTCAFLMDLSKTEGDAVNLVSGDIDEYERELEREKSVEKMNKLIKN